MIKSQRAEVEPRQKVLRHTTVLEGAMLLTVSHKKHQDVTSGMFYYLKHLVVSAASLQDMEKVLNTPQIKMKWIVLLGSLEGGYRCLELLAVMLEKQHDAMGREILKNIDSSLFEGVLAHQCHSFFNPLKLVWAEKYPTSSISKLCASIALQEEVFSNAFSSMAVVPPIQYVLQELRATNMGGLFIFI